MATQQTLEDIGGFATPRPANPVFCHQEFLEKLEAHSRDPIGKRATLLLQRISVDAARLHYKATHGDNRGWRRSRLGGNHGSHFYAWWTPKGAPPVKGVTGFAEAPAGALFLRDIRHHDDHTALNPQSFDDNYLPVTVPEIRREEYSPAPWTPIQSQFAKGHSPVRVLKGHPGSGKTTALWHAADAVAAERILYVTYSRELANLANDHFERFCSASKQFHVHTYSGLVRQILKTDTPVIPEHELRAQFRRDIGPFVRSLGIWQDQQAALFDEMHAHLVGDALPMGAGRFQACAAPRTGDKEYRERRTKFLGTATGSVLEAASRLERDNPRTLAERYFPELALAWRLAVRLKEKAIALDWLKYDCIAVDECQDLTAVESFVLVHLAALMKEKRKIPITMLVAGDEAQTVRPTDFEWGWLNDLLHSQLAKPQEFRLVANLRSPRRIAGIVNSVWDLYSLVQKQERPSGTGYAEIEDDSPDQILYCTAAPGAGLDQLFAELAGREGLAMITLEDQAPEYVPEALRPAVLTVREAKGLDFHSVCVLNAGKQLESIMKTDPRFASAGDAIEGLRKRLAIDQLRVALSRPAERLMLLDVQPTDQRVRLCINLLSGHGEEPVSPVIPEALLKAMEEEQLDVEERIQRCQKDARQFLEVRPEIAWSRAQQAVTLLGRPGTPAAIEDETVRRSAYATLAEVSFTLAFRGTKMPAEIGHPSFYEDAAAAAGRAKLQGLERVIRALHRVMRAPVEERLPTLAEMARIFTENSAQVPAWLRTEIAPKIGAWMDELEAGMFNAHNSQLLARTLPPFYESLGLQDAAAKALRLRQRAINALIKEKEFDTALRMLRDLPERQGKLEAACHEGMQNWPEAAAAYRSAGMLKEAISCYREVPNPQAALATIRELGGEHPASDSLQWILDMDRLVAARPDRFLAKVTNSEKKLLEEMVERALGATRKKIAAKKAEAKKTDRKKVERRVPF